MIIEYKNNVKYLVWSIDKERIFKSNKVNCGNVICGKKSCDKCIFELNEIDLSEFKILK